MIEERERAGATEPLRVAHHDLCFGCGLANVFGLQLQLEPTAEGALSGRFFVKQDHQGRDGAAHRGILATALEEAMALAVGTDSPILASNLQVTFHEGAPVGTFVWATARSEERADGSLWATAELRDDAGALLAEARALYVAPVTAGQA